MTNPQSRLDRFDRLVVVLVILVLCAALAIVARPLNAFFNEPLLDDGYYVLTIARRIALGQGVTSDGTTLSNGFQPLWTFLCAALLWLSDGERISGVRYVLILHWLLYALGAFLAAALAERVFAKSTDRPRSAALITALLFLSSSFIWSNGFNGMETSLSIACLLAAMLCYVSIDRKNRLHLAGCGALLGVVVLARVDAVFFVILLTAIQLVRRGIGWKERIVDALCLAGPAFLVSSPWWAYNVIAFGHLTPSSGLALQDWAPTRSRYMTSVGALTLTLTPMFDFLNSDTWPRAIARAPAPICCSTSTTRWTGGRGGPEALAEAKRSGNKPILLSVGYAACHWCHVMAHESFEDEATAAVMNELFVNIKVDREERPDIDQIYMNGAASCWASRAAGR
jgi:hypothetical protein